MNQNRLCVLAIVLLITTISITHSFPSGELRRDNDACTNLKQTYLKTHEIKYADVKGCYESFPYNSARSSELIDIFKRLYGNFYVHLNKAKEPPQPGFDYKPVDLLKEFDLLVEKNYQSDFEFTTAIVDLLSEMKDAHVSFNPNCYSIFQFAQEIYLYSVVKPDGTQVIQVYEYKKDPSLVDCEVTHINGEPVFDVLIKYAKTKISVSRDLGVRFNSALRSPLRLGYFAQRTKLPEDEIISYDILCSGQKSHLEIPWNITITNSSLFNQFEDASSYFENLCANPDKKLSTSASSDSIGKNDAQSADAEPFLEVQDVAKFYQLDDIGVVRVYSFGIPGATTNDFPNIYKSLIDGFNLLTQANVKKIVLDFTDNGGGYVDISSFLNILLLDASDQIYTLPDDMRVSKIAELAFKKSTTENVVYDEIFNAHLKIDAVTGELFNTSEEFIGTNYYNRGGDEVKFTNKYVNKLSTSAAESSKNITKLPWKPSDMIILTNGFCGSSCSLTTNYLTEIGQVPTVAVGGFYNKPLSFASFASGGVIPTDALIYTLQILGFNSSTDPSFYNIKASAQFTHVETYSIVNPDEVLEFTFRPAKYRLYYDKESIRNITVLWRKAASFIESS
ncbi:8944_t:CDS:2 [Acaulospora morrowiae]|uniref:8944_t:CDS:1 n=1 Tax=Acaulospora morrowiae TaxID=94023 RepID=A0A9N9CGP6_9GLOM|nr:8944_t:CDS:2 [Acaulospora morrowiae]